MSTTLLNNIFVIAAAYAALHKRTAQAGALIGCASYLTLYPINLFPALMIIAAVRSLFAFSLTLARLHAKVGCLAYTVSA